MTVRSLMLATRRAPADHDTQALVPRCHILIQHFYYGWYIVAIPDSGCLLSACLTQMWPRTVMVTVYKRWVTPPPKKKRMKSSVLTWSPLSCYFFFFSLFLELSTSTSFRCSCFTFMVLYLLPYFETLFPLRSFFNKD